RTKPRSAPSGLVNLLNTPNIYARVLFLPIGWQPHVPGPGGPTQQVLHPGHPPDAAPLPSWGPWFSASAAYEDSEASDVRSVNSGNGSIPDKEDDDYRKGSEPNEKD